GRDADRYRQPDPMLAVDHRLRAHPLADRLGPASRGLGVAAFDHDAELLAAVAADDRLRGEDLLEQAAEDAQHAVAAAMAEAIVDRLEVVDVDHHQRDRAGLTVAATQHPRGAVVE